MFFEILRAHLFLDDEDAISAQQNWFISPPFRQILTPALTSSTYQKVAQMHDKTYTHMGSWLVFFREWATSHAKNVTKQKNGHP